MTGGQKGESVQTPFKHCSVCGNLRCDYGFQVAGSLCCSYCSLCDSDDVGSLPRWPHSRSWGYYPSGGLGLVLVIVIILLVLGY